MNRRTKVPKQKKGKARKWKSFESNSSPVVLTTTFDVGQSTSTQDDFDMDEIIYPPLQIKPSYPAGEYDAAEYDLQDAIYAEALCLRAKKYYGPEDEQRICIWSGGAPISWTEKTSGISWIGVNGTTSTCVVAMDLKPLPSPSRIQLKSNRVLIPAVCDLGVWANITTPTTKFRRQMKARSSRNIGPFAVVSVAPGTVVVDDRDRAVDFLKKKLEGCSSLSFKEAKQVAVCALKYLLGPRFDSNMIEAYSFGKEEFWYGRFGAEEVEEYLTAIHNQT